MLISQKHCHTHTQFEHILVNERSAVNHATEICVLDTQISKQNRTKQKTMTIYRLHVPIPINYQSTLLALCTFCHVFRVCLCASLCFWWMYKSHRWQRHRELCRVIKRLWSKWKFHNIKKPSLMPPIHCDAPISISLITLAAHSFSLSRARCIVYINYIFLRFSWCCNWSRAFCFIIIHGIKSACRRLIQGKIHSSDSSLIIYTIMWWTDVSTTAQQRKQAEKSGCFVFF